MPTSSTLGFIWPKDPRPGNPTSWPRRWRFFDVLTNKGPDIYVGVIGEKKKKKESSSWISVPASTSTIPKLPEKTNWSGWENNNSTNNAVFPWARRDIDERYDFRQRKYKIPDRGTWCRVEYCSMPERTGWRRFGWQKTHRVPRRYWDGIGEEYPANYWHDVIYGEHQDADS